MDTFIYLFIIFLIVKVVQYVIKAGKEQVTIDTDSYEDNYSEKMYDLLDSCEGFEQSAIVEGVGSFYLFSIDRKNREFVFVLRDGTVYRFRYRSLVKCTIRKEKGSVIRIELETRDTKRPYINIECFDKGSVYGYMTAKVSDMSKLDELYELERKNIDNVKVLLEEVLAEADKSVEIQAYMPKVTPLSEAVPAEKPNLIFPISAVLDGVKEAQEKESVEEHQDAIFEDFQVDVAENYDTEVKIETTDIEEALEIESSAPISIEEIVSEDGKMSISLEEIEGYSRGKFLDWEVQSAISEAKVKGDKSILLTAEQIEALKK